MTCFSLGFVENLLIWLVVIIVIVGIIKLLIPALMGWFGAPPGGGAVMTALGYVLWGVVAVFVIILIFDLLSCVLGGGGLSLHGLR
jgi:hypothetical protein